MNFLPENINLLKTACAVSIAAAFALPIQADTVKNKVDGSWVSLSGKVVSHTPEAFTLDYGEGTILVETDDWDSIGDGWAINESDKVTVYGVVDNGFYESKTIEAGSVYIEDSNTMVTAPSTADEEGMPVTYTYFSVPADYDFQIAGTVTSISGREFTVDNGQRKVTVDTINMGYNPLDSIGVQQIEKGDFVSVSGDLDVNIFDNNEITAESIVSYN
ncbi:NirD/YgiW/YdeI family stress tolerance protein [Arsukibacterium sp.]|uniref:NirD/YgiW/YdeI family stress tolerance protein n=1 Tax=Arsukibacterium sp. TaxID=1977258 RepID=UPI00299E0E2E|nr:NirD/YgiW/YdeI family stress tolerance protein [Arsukibacterium sp.]MDX1536232.1 NirD/YgiW/YdeI family stress tolerance protein [Arsukibacterium sp.]